ncbi:MAG TPA: PEP-CTERM sorting domain-containing protein [Bryobacteraceae bacterium]|nr:PEP-CTERM sorting domain-containing protein [Bryobacteraceae bacterium]
MSFTRCLIRLAAGVGLAFALLPGAHATTIFYDFTMTATTGPLSGDTASGTFSYDSSSITPGTVNNSTGLLTSLNITWDGITYTQATANTGGLSFDGGGNLIDALFGTNCSAGSCSVTAGNEQWDVAVGSSIFDYTVPSDSQNTFGGTSSFSEVPEPSTMVLLSAGFGGLLALAAIRRRRETLRASYHPTRGSHSY